MRIKKLILLVLTVILAVLAIHLIENRQSTPDLPEEPVPGEQSEPGESRDDAVQPVVSRYTASRGVVTALEAGGVTFTFADGRESVTFADVSADDWYLDALNFVASNGLMSGISEEDGTVEFRADYGITRAQFAVLLLHFSAAEVPASAAELPDVEAGSWYHDGAVWAVENDLLTAQEDGSFQPEGFVSCEEVIAALFRLAGEPQVEGPLPEEYPYGAKVSDSALPAVVWAWSVGLIAEDSCVWYPTQAASRGQLALILMRYDALVGITAE